MTDKEKCYCQVCGAELEYNWIEKQNREVFNWLVIVFVSMVTALLTTIGYTMSGLL